MKDAHQLPQVPNLYLELEHQSKILQNISNGACQTEKTDLLNLNSGIHENPLYWLTITQDLLTDINRYSDFPLLFKLMQIEEAYPEEAEDGFEKSIKQEPLIIAKGHIDLLQFVDKVKIFSSVRTFLYPVAIDDEDMPTGYLNWHIYSSFPILKELSILNIMFINLESIFNCDFYIHSEKDPSDIIVSVCFRRKETQNSEMEKKILCSFRYGYIQSVAERNINEKWENLKGVLTTEKCLGVYTGEKLVKHFETVYKNDYKDIDFKELSPESNALVFNSLHRFVLTDNMPIDLKEVASMGNQGMWIELCYREKPEEILLHGSLDLSPLLYPKGKFFFSLEYSMHSFSHSF